MNQPNQPYPAQPPTTPPPPMQPGWSPTQQPAPQYVQQMRQAVPPPYAPQPFQAQPYAAPYVIPPRPFNHGKHVIGDLVTFGCWVPFHLLLWAMHSRKSTVVMPDGSRDRR